MNQWFGQEGYLQTVFSRIWDWTVLNMCFLVSSLPVVTVGAAWSALFSVNLRAVRREEGGVFADYRRAFRENFAGGTKLWAIAVAVGVLFAVDFWALSLLEGTAVWVLKALLGGLLAVYLAVLPWVFAYNARFEDRAAVVLKNALLLCAANLPVTAAMLCISFLVIFLSFYSLAFFLRAVFVWGVLGFGALNYLQAYLLRRVFDRI